MTKTAKVSKTLNSLQVTLDAPASIVVLKAEFDGQSAFHVENFKGPAKAKSIAYPSDIFKLGLVKAYVYPLMKDTGHGTRDFYCLECGATSVYECEHVPVGDYVLGKEDTEKKGIVDLTTGE